MKLNWGTSIAIFYSLFVIVMIGAVIKATQWGVPLVQDEYYQADIEYEEFRMKKVNTSKLKVKPSIVVNKNGKSLTLFMSLSSSPLKGEVHLYRPSQTGTDQKLPLNVNENGQMVITTTGFQTGRWVVKLNWTSENKDYYWEDNIFL